MNKDKLVADLGRASKMLLIARSRPQCRCCSALLADAHRTLQGVIKDIKVSRSVNLRRMASSILQLLTGIVSLVLKLLSAQR